MIYRLGLDVGTASIALVCVSLDDHGKPIEIIYHSDRIFQEPLDPGKKGGVGEPKKARRRKARLARKLIDRRAGRLRAIADLCRLIDISPASVKPDDGQHLHKMRADAVGKPIPLDGLIRVFLRLSKRRGYSGGFRTKREDQEEGKVEGGISQLKKAMQEANPSCEYLGQYLWHRFQKGETLKLKNVGLYTERDMLEKEFDKIWEVQSQAHSALNGAYQGRPLREIFRNTIFCQRPLKSVSAMVGNCQLEPSLPRAPMAQPAVQAFRIEKQIADLRWGSDRRSELLTNEQKDVIRGLLSESKTVSFEGIYKTLKKAGCYDARERTLNTDRFSRQELRGDSTGAVFRALDKKIEKKTSENPGFFAAWQALPPGVQVSTINFLADLGSPQEVDRPDWHLQYRREDGTRREFKPEMVAFINRMVESGEFDRLGKMGFDGGRAAYSVKALNQLTAKMREGLDEDKAAEALYGKRNQITGEIKRRLGLPTQTGNTVVDVALRELWREVNKLLDVLKEPPAEVIVELTRDMGLGVKRRQDIEIKIARNQSVRKKAAEELVKHDYHATASNIHRYLLWQEQDFSCPYCEKKLGLSEAVDGNITNREHIVPRSLTRVGRQGDHLVLAHRSCNDEKGARTPYDAWGKSDPVRWALIEAHADRLKKKKLFTKARLLTLKDYEAEVLDDEAIEGFSARQFHETSWIAKLAALWLREICLNVAVSRGALTAYLRRIWGLDTVIPQMRYEESMPVLDTDKQPVNKEDFDRYRRYWEGHDRGAAGVEMTDRRLEKRIDHRHHVVDALVTAMTSRSLFMKMALNYKALAERRNAGERVWPTLAEEPPMPSLRKQALEMIRHCNLTHKPDRYPSGALFKENPYGVMWVESGSDLNADPVQYLTQRKSLVGLSIKENKPLSIDKVRKNLENIAHKITREAVQQAFEAHITKGLTPQQALAEPIKHPDLHTPIKKVKMLQDWTSDVAARIEHVGRNTASEKPYYKYLAHDGYACLEIYRNKPEMRPVRPVPLQEALSKVQGNSAELLYKGDTVQDTKDNRVFTIKQIKAQGDGLLVMIPITEAREVEEIQKLRKLLKENGWPEPPDFRTVSGRSIFRLQRLA